LVWSKQQDNGGKNLKVSCSDPCLFIKEDKVSNTKSFLIVYVDDGGIFGTPDEIKKVLHELSKTFIVIV
jgi:hypothetical protein